jgi:hypothetical protein
VNIRVQVFTADASSGVPLDGVALAQLNAVPIPISPSYVTLPLSTLLIDAAGALGTHYALVLSFSAPVDWHSVEGITDGQPDAGVASVYGSWVRVGVG